MSKVIVFGGSGFIGSHLIGHLASSHNHVVSVDIREPSLRLPHVEYLTADVRDLSRLQVSGPISRAYNLAAVHTTPGHDAHEYYETNILGADSVVGFAERNQVQEIVFTSSISVYGSSEMTKDESSEPAPNSHYGWSKLLAEKIHMSWWDRDHGRKLTIARPAVVFGAREGGNFTRLASLLRKGVFFYAGRRDTVKACVYVKDLIQFVEKARSLDGQSFVMFNGCYPDRYTIEQIVTTFEQRAFPRVRSFTVPHQVLRAAANVLRPFAGLSGVHPERVMKLARSTDIYPAWLERHGLTASNRLPAALDDWAADSGGRFD